MGAFAALLVGIGIIVVIYGAIMKFKAGRIAKAPLLTTGDAVRRGGGEKGAVSVEGSVQCPQPLLSPVTGTPCLYYELKVVGSWKEGDQNKEKDYVHEKVAAPFALDDGSGAIPIDACKGGDFDMQQTFNEEKKEGFFADLKSAVGKGEPIMFGHYAFPNPPMSKANKFRCTERVLPMPQKLFALGKLEQGVLTTPGFTSLMLSPKSRDDLLGSSAKSAKMAFIGGAASAGVGLVVGVISALVG